jgi:hypothetical protein
MQYRPSLATSEIPSFIRIPSNNQSVRAKKRPTILGSLQNEAEYGIKHLKSTLMDIGCRWDNGLVFSSCCSNANLIGIATKAIKTKQTDRFSIRTAQ